MQKYSLWLLLVLAMCGMTLSGELPPQECPMECSCHYHRVHWVAECAHRGLAKAPLRLAPATNTLDLSGNALEAFVVDPTLKLRRIILINNKLDTLDSYSFKGLSYLIDVDVSGNKLKTISRDAFTDNPGLITFEARRNKAFEGPLDGGSLIESRTLQTLDLADCRISVVGTTWFSKSPALRKIILSGNPIHTVEKDAFSSLQGLDELHLSRTQIRRLSASDLGVDPPLRTLFLNHNRLEDVVISGALFLISLLKFILFC